MSTSNFSTAEWCKSSRSEANGACVEVAVLDGRIGVRDSKDPAGPVLTFDPRAWSALLADIKAGRVV